MQNKTRRCPKCLSIFRPGESYCASCDIDVPAAIGIAVAILCDPTEFAFELMQREHEERKTQPDYSGIFGEHPWRAA